MDVLIYLIMGIHSCISNHIVVHVKYFTILFVIDLNKAGGKQNKPQQGKSTSVWG